MTYEQMISLLPDKDSPVDTVGRSFFASATSQEDRKKLLEFLLDGKRYEQLYRLICCGHINGHINTKNTSADYVAMTGGASTLNTRYFSLFVQTALDCGLSERKYVPLLFSAATSDKRSILRNWKNSSMRYLAMLAAADYNRAWDYLRKNDADFKLVSVLMEADSDRALTDLINLAIFGKGVNKVAIRNFLRGYKQEVYDAVRPVYSTLKTDERIAAVRLLLLFKNDAEVLDLLHDIARTEKAKSVQKLLRTGDSVKSKISENPDKKQISEFFRDAMVRGVSVSCESFLMQWIVPPYGDVADSLFFGVYNGNTLYKIAIVDNGKVFDLDNAPLILPPDCTVRVLHPTELTAKTEFLTRLNITQPFPQIKRKVYLPSADDKSRNACYGVSGTVLKAGEFKFSMRKLGFRVLHTDDGICNQVGLRRDGVLCVLNIAPIDLASADDNKSVQAQFVRFYDDKSVVRLGGKMFVDGVAPLSVASLDARIFSEFMYSVYELMGCR